MVSACSLTFLRDAEAMGPAVVVVITRRHEVLAEISQWGDGSSREGGSGMEVMSSRYYLQSPGPQGSELAAPCSLFPYQSAAGAPHGSVYSAPNGARYPYGSMLPSGGFPAAVCPPGRAQFGPGTGASSGSGASSGGAGGPGAYQYSQGAPLYGPYPGTAATGSCGGWGSLEVSGSNLRAHVYLCNRPLWLKFHRHQTEMIITKQGR